MIIDMHMHLEEMPSLGWQMSADDCIAAMDAAGVEKAAVMTITDFPGVNPAGLDIIAEACRSHPDRLFGFIRLNPAREESKELLTRGATELGFKGLKLHPVSSLQHPGGHGHHRAHPARRRARDPDTVPLRRRAAQHSPVNRAGRGRLS
ncbi:MAG: uncharacterized protein QOH87_4685 [Trebonia sp.]|nr:uncharacterized protein [Trebonia sp.]